MIGFYDYTVILTYLSLLSAATGIALSLVGEGHPYLGCMCLLFCGFCDAFDGKVARSKKGRTEMERNYGIQIDSLSDLVAFGVLPAAIGAALIRRSAFMASLSVKYSDRWYFVAGAMVLFAILILYVLAAMIRLAYFNVTEEERQRKEGGVRKYYVGLPVTSACLIFPFVLMLDYLIPRDIALVYIVTALATGLAFLSRVRVPKVGLRGLLILTGIGGAEGILLMVVRHLRG